MTGKYQGSKEHRANALLASNLGQAWHREQRKVRVLAYEKSPKQCEYVACSNTLPYSRRANRFCSRTCAAFHNTALRDCSHPEERRKKIQATLLNNSVSSGIRSVVNKEIIFKRPCAWCGNEFTTEKRRTKTCSVLCQQRLSQSKIDPVERTEKARSIIRARMAAGEWHGWSGRGAPSFPESYISNLLAERSVVFQCEYPVDRFSLDFAFPDLKIDFEVDGKQHEYQKQKEHDAIRDEFMKARGWTVFRLKWASIKTESGRLKVHEQFDRFMELLVERIRADNAVR